MSEWGGESRTSNSVSHYFIKNALLRPKYLRKINWRILVRVIPDKDVARFIHSRLGEVRIGEARYDDLLTTADEWYPKALQALENELSNLYSLRTVEERIKP